MHNVNKMKQIKLEKQIAVDSIIFRQNVMPKSHKFTGNTFASRATTREQGQDTFTAEILRH